MENNVSIRKLGVEKYSQLIFVWAMIFANIGTVTHGVGKSLKQETLLYLITTFSVIIYSPLNVDWFFSGIEDYKL